MDIKKIAKEYTRKEFLEWSEDCSFTKYKLDCPDEVNLQSYCGSMDCRSCWENAIKNIKFKGEDNMEEKFTKADLKDGMMVETVSKEIFLVLKDKLITKDGFLWKEDLKENMEFIDNVKFNIIKVYSESNAFRLDELFNKNNLSLVWERKEQKPVDFKTVVLSDKACKVKHKIVCKMEYENLDDLMHYLSSNFDSEHLREIIKNGKWYLKEEN